MESFLGWERNKYYAIVCNYCGKTEFYNVQMSGADCLRRCSGRFGCSTIRIIGRNYLAGGK